MKVIKTQEAYNGFGDRGAIIRQPAQYALVDDNGRPRALINGRATYMSKTEWRVQSLQADGTPRYVAYANTLKLAEEKARKLIAKLDEEAKR